MENPDMLTALKKAFILTLLDKQKKNGSFDLELPVDLDQVSTSGTIKLQQSCFFWWPKFNKDRHTINSLKFTSIQIWPQ